MRARVIVANEAQVKERTVALIKHSVAQGKIDRSLKPDLVATWLLALAEGAVGRVVFEPAFKPRAPGDAADDHSAEVEAAAGIAMPV